jgi:hypothetical protein
MADDWHWYSGKATNEISLTPSAYNAIPPLKWVPPISGQGLVFGYLKCTATLKAGHEYGRVRRNLTRAKTSTAPEDPTWYDDQTLIRYASQRTTAAMAKPAEFEWSFWMPPWGGEIEQGRSLSVMLKPYSEFEKFVVSTRYLQAFVLNELD